jgi:hypothetical protein
MPNDIADIENLEESNCQESSFLRIFRLWPYHWSPAFIAISGLAEMDPVKEQRTPGCVYWLMLRTREDIIATRDHTWVSKSNLPAVPPASSFATSYDDGDLVGNLRLSAADCSTV